MMRCELGMQKTRVLREFHFSNGPDMLAGSTDRHFLGLCVVLSFKIFSCAFCFILQFSPRDVSLVLQYFQAGSLFPMLPLFSPGTCI